MVPHLKLLQLAMLNGLPLSWTFRRRDRWRPLAAQNLPIGVDHARLGVTRANGQGIALQCCIGPRSAHHTPAASVNSVLPLV